jgi:hypothetical protein
MTQVEVTPPLMALKGDPRFASLLPSRSDFDNPFVERMERCSRLPFWTGLHYFQWSQD